MTKPPALMRKLSGASDAEPKQSNASDAASGGEPAPAADAPKPWEAPAWRAHCAQEREAARQVKPYESDLVEGLGARFGCVATGEERTAPERSDEEMWHATGDSLASLKKACMEYGISASIRRNPSQRESTTRTSPIRCRRSGGVKRRFWSGGGMPWVE